MKLIVGLGNPGRKYEGTRHNIGWEVLRELMRRHASGQPRTKFRGEICEAQMGGCGVLLLAPQTFMNLSGTSVLPARDFYKVSDEEILVICDDFHLPLAKLRFRPTGSPAGQKGLADILNRLGTQSISRLRFGIGEPPANWDVSDYVLSKFGKDELREVESAVTRAADAVADWVRWGTAECMNRYNAAPKISSDSRGKSSPVGKNLSSSPSRGKQSELPAKPPADDTPKIAENQVEKLVKKPVKNISAIENNSDHKES